MIVLLFIYYKLLNIKKNNVNGPAFLGAKAQLDP